MSLKLVLLYAMLLSVLYYKWSRAIVQSACTYDDLTLTNIQISTDSWISLMGLLKSVSSY